MKYGKYRVNMIANSAYQEKANALSNVGEGVQALTMDYIFSQIGIKEQDIEYVNRDEDFSDEKFSQEMILPVHIGVFGENPKRLPLPDSVTPVFTSMVIYYDCFDQNPELLDYFKRYEPVGCRDEQSKQILLKHGIKAYLMGCFTVCWPRRKHAPENGKVFFVDTPQELNNNIPPDIQKDAVYLTHSVPFAVYPVTVEEDERQKEIARTYFRRYRDEARLVVTSRLHAAIPCAAMGIPVILIRDNYDFRFGWVEKYFPLYTLEDADHINWSPASVDMSFARTHIISYLKSAFFGLPDRERLLKELDAFYCDRDKAMLNKKTRGKIKDAFDMVGKEDMVYAVWGAGAHCRFVHDIIQEMYPKAKPVVIVDRFVKGTLFDVPIITGDQLRKYQFDHLFITTLPGKGEAVAMMESMYGAEAALRYSIITTRMTS